MPKIPQYEAPVDSLRPSEEGVRAVEGAADVQARLARYQGGMASEAGQRIGGAIATVGRTAQNVLDRVDQHDTMQDVSVGSAALAVAHDNMTTDWNKIASTADPNDHSIQQKFNEGQLEPFLQKWQEGFHTDAGQKWAMGQADEFRNQFYKKQSADMVSRSQDAAIGNYKTTQNALSNTTFNDPTSLDHAVSMLKGNVEGLIGSGSFTPEQAGKLREQAATEGAKTLAVSAVQGMARRNPTQAMADLDSGKFDAYFSGEEKNTLTTFIGQQQKAAERDQREQRILANQETEQASQRVGANFLSKLQVGPDGSITVPQGWTQDVVTAAGKQEMKLPEAKSLLQFQSELRAASDAKNDPATVADLYGRIGSPQNPTTREQITQAMADKKVSPSTGMELGGKLDPNVTKQLSQISQDPLLKQEFDRVGAVLNGNALAGNAAVRDATATFKTDALRTIQAGVQQGKPLDNYLNPSSPDYLFTEDRVKQYIPTNQEKQMAVIKWSQHIRMGQQQAAPPPGRPELPDIRDLFKAPPGP